MDYDWGSYLRILALHGDQDPRRNHKPHRVQHSREVEPILSALVVLRLKGKDEQYNQQSRWGRKQKIPMSFTVTEYPGTVLHERDVRQTFEVVPP